MSASLICYASTGYMCGFNSECLPSIINIPIKLVPPTTTAAASSVALGAHSIKGTTATVEFNCESRTQTHIQFMGSVINSKGQNINHNLCMWVYLWPHNIMPLNVPEFRTEPNQLIPLQQAPLPPLRLLFLHSKVHCNCSWITKPYNKQSERGGTEWMRKQTPYHNNSAYFIRLTTLPSHASFASLVWQSKIHLQLYSILRHHNHHHHHHRIAVHPLRLRQSPLQGLPQPPPSNIMQMN